MCEDTCLITLGIACQDIEQTYIKAFNTETGSVFGLSVALVGDTLVVGAPNESSTPIDINGNPSGVAYRGSGAVYVFERDSLGLWRQVAFIKASNPRRDNNFGHAVALDGDTLAVGAHGEYSIATGINGDENTSESAGRSGAVYVFVRNAAGQWNQQAYIKASNTGVLDSFGETLALSGHVLAVGAPQEDSLATGTKADQHANPTEKKATNTGA